MPTVPYTGTLSVAPQDNPIPRYEAQVTPDMFGANIGNAIRQLGQTEDNVGNEIFARGVAMQDLANHSEANQADADYIQKAGSIYEDFKTKMGKDAVEGLPDYQKALADSRTQIRDGLSNGMSQKLFDSTSLSTFAKTTIYVGAHAATQNRSYALSASSAKVQAIADRTLSTPADDDAFQDGLSDAEDEVRAQGQLKGLAPEAIDEAVSQNTSMLWSQRIKGLVKVQPFQAGKMLDQAVKDGDVQGEDIGKLTNIVQSAQNTVGARQVSHTVMTGANNKFGEGPVDIKQAAQAISQIESGGNYNAIGVTTAHGQALGKYQIMEDFLPDYLARAGMQPMSRDEFLTNHAAQDQVFAANFGAFMKQTGSANDAASMWLTGKPLAEAGNAKDALGTDAGKYVTRFNAALAQNAPLADKVAMGGRLAQDAAPDNPLFPDYVQQRIESDANRQRAIQRDDDFQIRSVIETGLMGGQDGKLPTSVDELTADPKTADAWEKLQQSNPAAARRYLGVLAHNAKGDTAWTTENLKTYQQMKGMAQADPADFIDTDVIGTSLPVSAKKELINLQQSLKGKAEGDPAVTRALQQLAPMMQPAGVTRADKDDYYKFVGALQDALHNFGEDNKRPAKLEDVQKIGARLLQDQGAGHWYSSTERMYTIPVPADVEAEVKKQHPEWEHYQIQREYTRQKYQKLYGGTPKQQAVTQ